MPDLVALRAIKNNALASETLPTRIKLLNWGENKSTKGTVIVDDTTVTSLATNQRALGFDRIALDYEHNTVPGTDEFNRTKEPRDISGMWTPEVVVGDGLYLSAGEWNEGGKKSAKNFADLSPAVALDKQNRVTFIHSAALTRNGSVFDLSFFSANQTPNPQNKNMPPETFSVAEMAAIVGLPETTSKADVQKKLSGNFLLLAALSAALGEVKENKVGVLSSLQGEVAGLQTLVKGLKPGEGVVVFSATGADGKSITLKPEEVASKLINIESLLTTRNTSEENAARTQIISAFTAEGKVPKKEDATAYSATELAALPVATLKLLQANTPVTVPLSARKQNPEQKATDEKLTGAARAGSGWSHLKR